MKPPKNFNPEPFPYHALVEVEIEDLSSLGQGVGRIDGWVVFVPRALPGELVRARIWRNKKSYSDADLDAVLRPSPDRVEPGCSLFGVCGGCQYQHYSYAKQLEWKTRQVETMLKRLGGIEFQVNACIGSPKEYGYRSKITPHFRKPPNQEGVPIGFEKADSRAMVDIPHCPIAHPEINKALPIWREKLKSGEVPFKRGGTLLLRIADDGVEASMKARVTETVDGIRFRFVAGEFFQNNPFILPKFIEWILNAAKGDGVDYLVDAYCGVGVFGICGSTRFEAFSGIEVNARAIEDAQFNAVENKVENGSFIEGSAEAIFEDIKFPAERTVVLLDPPRRGSDEQFLRQLLHFGPRRIVYVSCGPDTQVRDLKVLLEGPYRLVELQPFDLFPQTRHIENVAVLERVEDQA